MNWQWNPCQPAYPQGGYWNSSWYPYYPYTASPGHTRPAFRNPPLPTYSNAIGNVPLPKVNPPINDPVISHTPKAPRFPFPPGWGEPVEPVYMPDRTQQVGLPQPATDLPDWDRIIEHAGDRQPIDYQGSENYNYTDSAFPGAVPHNDDKWPWNINNRLPVAADVARRQFSMRRPAKAKLRRRHSGLSRIPVLNEFTLAPRPSDWRPDYPARPFGLLRQLSRIREPKSPRLPGGNYTINALLLYSDRENYPVNFDLRLEPEVSEITFMNLDRPSNNLDFCQLATTPPVDELCLWHPRLPWYIQIRASQSNGVTIQDVFCQMHDHLEEPIWANHYWNVELSSKDREEMRATFQYRCDGNRKLWKKGIARIDFLRFDCVFMGLAKSKDGMWEIKTKEATV